jgi:sugar O-acyltransferase (sialic acid O-acetyltransferase NeuD family)
VPIHGNGGHAAVVRELTITPADGWIVAVGDNSARRKESRNYERFARGIHPSAVVSPSAIIGPGTVIMAGAVVQAQATIGAHCILNTGCSADHHAIVADYVHIGPGARLCGAVIVGEGAFIGAGAICLPGAKVPPWFVVSAGTVYK